VCVRERRREQKRKRARERECVCVWKWPNRSNFAIEGCGVCERGRETEREREKVDVCEDGPLDAMRL